MKKIFYNIISILLVFTISGCGNNNSINTSDYSEDKEIVPSIESEQNNVSDFVVVSEEKNIDNENNYFELSDIFILTNEEYDGISHYRNVSVCNNKISLSDDYVYSVNNNKGRISIESFDGYDFISCTPITYKDIDFKEYKITPVNVKYREYCEYELSKFGQVICNIDFTYENMTHTPINFFVKDNIIYLFAHSETDYNDCRNVIFTMQLEDNKINIISYDVYYDEYLKYFDFYYLPLKYEIQACNDCFIGSYDRYLYKLNPISKTLKLISSDTEVQNMIQGLNISRESLYFFDRSYYVNEKYYITIPSYNDFQGTYLLVLNDNLTVNCYLKFTEDYISLYDPNGIVIDSINYKSNGSFMLVMK